MKFKKKKILILLISLIVLMSIITGCSGGNVVDQVKEEMPLYSKEEVMEYNKTEQQAFNGWFEVTPIHGYDDPTIYMGYYSDKSEITEITYNYLKNYRHEEFLPSGITYVQNLEALVQLLHSRMGWEAQGDDEYGLVTVEWRIKKRIMAGCTSNAHTFAVLCRASGIPAIVVGSVSIDTINDYLDNGIIDHQFQGHYFVEVYIKGKWYLVDQNAGIIYLDYDKNNRNLEDGIIYAKSIDNWEYGYDMNAWYVDGEIIERNYFEETGKEKLQQIVNNFEPYISENYIDGWDYIGQI